MIQCKENIRNGAVPKSNWGSFGMEQLQTGVESKTAPVLSAFAYTLNIAKSTSHPVFVTLSLILHLIK
jgi:hypothetical protein